MRCRVFPLRRRGRRLPWREVVNAPSFEGDLSTYYLSLPGGCYFVAKLAAPGDALCKPILVNAGNWALALRGFERLGEGEGAVTVVQDWRCEIITRGCCTELTIWFPTAEGR